MERHELWKHIDEQINQAGHLMRGRQWANAANQLEKAICSAHDHPSVHIFYNMLGSCYLSLKDVDKAVKAWNASLKAKPDFHDARANLGYVFLARRQWRQALDSYLSVLQNDKNHKFAQSGMGMFLDELARSRNVESLVNLSRDEQLMFLSVLNKENEIKFLKLWAVTKRFKKL